MTDTDTFWDKVNAQLEEAKTATSADQLLAIFSHARNPYGDPSMAANAEGFFAGDSSELLYTLTEHGWSPVWLEANYHWALRAPDATIVTYIEGDMFKGNQKPLPHGMPKES